MVRKIHHVALAVRDIDQALLFWRDALGLHQTVDQVVEEQGVRGALLECGSGEIELIAPSREGTGVARFVERGEGLHHVCFESADVAKALTDTKARGSRLIDETPRWGLAGKIGFVHPAANNGVLVEYAQPMAGNPVLESMTFTPVHPEPSAGITNLDHVVAAVNDVDAAAKQWSVNFGLPVERIGENQGMGIRQAILPIAGSFVELISPLGEGGPVAESLKTKGEGLYLISLSTSNLAGTLEALRAKGVRVNDPPEGGTVTFISPRAANGVLVQLVERKEGPA
jgi:methylmalonyl-CoA/ethylmalonyl-CoA epimerase